MAEVVRDASSFRAEKAWGARDLVEIDGVTARLHWTNEPYVWHANDGKELFCVIDGVVEMRYRVGGKEQTAMLRAGDMFIADTGDEHVAQPVGEARILVVERKGSI